MVSLSLSEESAAETCRSSTTREPSGCETQQRRLRIQPGPRPLARSHLKLHSVACLNKIRFHPFANEIGINIKTVAHGSAAVQDLRLGSVTEEETEVAGEDFVNIAEPGASAGESRRPMSRSFRRFFARSTMPQGKMNLRKRFKPIRAKPTLAQRRS